MKKALSFISFVVGNVLIASAQLNINGSIKGTPVSYSTNNGGTLNIGTGAGFGTGQVSGGPLMRLLSLAQTIVSRLVPFAIGLALLAFFWYLINFLWKGAEDPKKHEDGMKGMGYSILALFVMVSIWGIISVMGSILGVSQGGGLPPIQMPTAR